MRGVAFFLWISGPETIELVYRRTLRFDLEHPGQMVLHPVSKFVVKNSCIDICLAAQFVRQFKRILQWLMRIFFAASIGFQVPIKDFGDFEVIWQGLFFTLALLGKLAEAVGL